MGIEDELLQGMKEAFPAATGRSDAPDDTQVAAVVIKAEDAPSVKVDDPAPVEVKNDAPVFGGILSWRLRLATPEEIKKQKLKDKLDKFNI